jgi:hypothetical protein
VWKTSRSCAFNANNTRRVKHVQNMRVWREQFKTCDMHPEKCTLDANRRVKHVQNMRV